MRLRYPGLIDDGSKWDQKIVYGDPVDKRDPSYYRFTQLDNSKFDVKEGEIGHAGRTPVQSVN